MEVMVSNSCPIGEGAQTYKLFVSTRMVPMADSC